MDWRYALLKGDPFLVEAPTDAPRAVWANAQTLKRRLEGIISTSLSSGITQVVFNRGDWGVGKTHASVYFSHPRRLKELGAFQGRIVLISTPTPKDPDTTVQEFYERVLESISWQEIRQWIKDAIDNLGENVVKEQLFSITRDADVAGVILLLGKPGWSEHWLRRYLLGSKLTARELSSLQVAKALPAYRRADVLAAILRAAIGFNKSHLEGRVFIWVDEVEDLNFYPSRRRRDITQMWRDLVDALPRGLTLLFNYTPARGEKGDVRGILGAALVSRITQSVTFEPLDEEEAYQYVCELLNASLYRAENPNGYNLPETYPFESEAVRHILSRITRRTPRNINLACGEILRTTLREGFLQGIGKGIIDVSFVDRAWPSDLLAREEELLP